MARFNGNFSGIDLSDLTGSASARPTPPPPPPAPRPAPAAPQTPPPTDPFAPPPSNADNGNNGRRRKGGWGKWVIRGIVFAVVVGILLTVMFKVVIPAVNNKSGDDTNPSTSQDVNPNPSTTPDNRETPGEEPSDSGSETLDDQSMTEQAATLAPWFKGVAEDNWLTKTAADLGGSATMPLGQFCGSHLCVVTTDGTVILRGTTEDGAKAAIIVSDYTVPEGWTGKAVALYPDNMDVAVVIDKMPDGDFDQIPGGIWKWDTVSCAYFYSKPGYVTQGKG